MLSDSKKKDSTVKIDLGSKALLAELRLSVWTNTTSDESACQVVAQVRNTNTSEDRYLRPIIPRQYTKAVNSAFRALYTFHKGYTLPWLDGGARVLPSSAFTTYTGTMRALKDRAMLEVDRLLQRYPYIVVERNIANAPSIDELRSKYGIRNSFLPFPDADDFRIELDEETMTQIRSDAQQSITEQITSAEQGLIAQLRERVQKMVDVLEPEHRMHSSVFDIANEMAVAGTHMNLTGNQRLVAVCNSIINFHAGFEIELARKNDVYRLQAQKQAEAILGI